jgi:hypothetical protein
MARRRAESSAMSCRLYPASGQAATRIVRVTHDPPPDAGAVNPDLHRHLDDGFVARYPNAAVRFRFAGARLAETEAARVLTGVECSAVRVPIGLAHAAFRRTLADMLTTR